MAAGTPLIFFKNEIEEASEEEAFPWSRRFSE
jgi:hypothetical protein